MAGRKKDNMKIVITGHIDHGKSTLIGRLMYDTGSLPEGKIEQIEKTCLELGRELEFAYILDFFREEREEEKTIDTTQIFFRSKKRNYNIIDAPGHKEFIKNMITGASQAEAAVLIVDVVEGVMEQTRRHAYILKMIGIENLIVVMNKLNLVDYSQKRFEEVRDDLMKFLDSLGTKPNHIIPINAKGGDNLLSNSSNMAWYTGPALLDALDSLETGRKVHSRTLCFPVQDVYDGILLGRVESGIVSKGQSVVLLPSGKDSSVAEIVKYDKTPEKASSGECIGLRLAEGSCASRGTVISGKDSHLSFGDSIKANIFWISEKEFDISKPLTIKIASQKIACKISQVFRKIDSSTLAEIKPDRFFRHTEVGYVEISCESEAVHSSFNSIPALGRFVLVIDDEIVAGGIIK